MANLQAAKSTQYGYDPIASTAVVRVGEKYPMLLYGGEDMTLSIVSGGDNAEIQDFDSTRTSPRAFNVYGKKEGRAELTGTLVRDVGGWKAGGEFIERLKVQVVAANTNHSQVQGQLNTAKGVGSFRMGADFKKELAGMSWRDALIRIAQDQMNSEIGATGEGGKFTYDDGTNWCGSFVSFLYAMLGEVNSAWRNGLGSGLGTQSPLRSGIKALSFGMRSPNCTVLNYAGSDLFAAGTPAITTMRAVGSGVELLPGDVCLPRDEFGIFRHVCILYKAPKGPHDSFDCIDGNAFGSYVPNGMARGQAGCIAYSHKPDATEMVTVSKAKRPVTEVVDGNKTTTMVDVQYAVGTKFPMYVFVHINSLS